MLEKQLRHFQERGCLERLYRKLLQNPLISNFVILVVKLGQLKHPASASMLVNLILVGQSLFCL